MSEKLLRLWKSWIRAVAPPALIWFTASLMGDCSQGGAARER